MNEKSRSNVWVTWSQDDSPPPELQWALGLLIMLPYRESVPYAGQDSVQPCAMTVLSGNPSHTRISAKFILLDTPDKLPSENELRDRLPNKPYWMSLADFQSQFGSLAFSIGNRRAYANLRQSLSPNVAQRLLLLANDLCALNELRPNSRVLRRVRTSPHDLWSQFFREDEERFALVEFRSIMGNRGKANTSLGRVNWIAADVPLWGGNYVLPLRLNFPEVLGQQQLQNVVIGPNGSGKTNLLLGLAKCAAKRQLEFGLENADIYDPSGSPPLQVAVFTYERSMWATLRRLGVAVYEQGVRASDWRKLTQLIYEIPSLRPERIDSIRDIRLLQEILSGFIDVSELWFPLHPVQHATPGSQRENIDELVEISLKRMASLRGDYFMKTIARLDRGKAPLMRTKEGQEYALSSGERSLVLFCTRLIVASRDSALVLIDEPENHLHPRFITLMIQTLARTLQATGARALLVTHSPFVVREFERSTVMVLKKSEEGVPQMYRPSLQTLGADVSMISDYVFEDERIRKGFQDSIDRAIRVEQFQGALDGAKLNSLATSLGDDAMSYLIERSKAATGETPNA